MKKTVVIVLVLVAAVWYKQKDTSEGSNTVVQNTVKKQPHSANLSECEKIGGRMVEGMGCVKGPVPDDLKFNQHLDPQIVEEDCDNVGGRYDADKNMCWRG